MLFFLPDFSVVMQLWIFVNNLKEVILRYMYMENEFWLWYNVIDSIETVDVEDDCYPINSSTTP